MKNVALTIFLMRTPLYMQDFRCFLGEFSREEEASVASEWVRSSYENHLLFSEHDHLQRWLKILRKSTEEKPSGLDEETISISKALEVRRFTFLQFFFSGSWYCKSSWKCKRPARKYGESVRHCGSKSVYTRFSHTSKTIVCCKACKNLIICSHG